MMMKLQLDSNIRFPFIFVKKNMKQEFQIRVEICSNSVATKSHPFYQINGRSGLREMYGLQSDINTVLCSENCSFYLPSYSVTDAILQLQQNRLCGKVQFGLKAVTVLCTLGSRSLSTPLCRITVEIRCAIVIALPFPGDKGVNGCLYSSTGLRIIKGSRVDVLGNRLIRFHSGLDERICSNPLPVQ